VQKEKPRFSFLHARAEETSAKPKLRISEQSAKRKTKFFFLARLSGRNFGEAKVTNKRGECKKKDEVFLSCTLERKKLRRSQSYE